MHGYRSLAWVMPLIIALTLGAVTAEAQWNNSALLVTPADASYQIKDGRITAAATGGFHALYKLASGPGGLRYRRYQSGAMSGTTSVSGFFYNPEIAEAGNGDIHIVVENWGAPNAPECGWATSTNGGASFLSPVNVSNIGAGVKFPFIVPFGGPGSADVVAAYWDSEDWAMRYQRYNGSSWSPSSGSWFADCESEYFSTGMGRSPVDGTLFRTYGRKINGEYAPCYRQYNGAGWGGEVVAASGFGFFAWPFIQINDAGDVMLIWERDNQIVSRWYRPGIGWSDLTNVGTDSNHGHLTAIPGTNHFYCTTTPNVNRVRGYLWVEGHWLNAEVVNVNKPTGFYPAVKVAADAGRNIYAAWENWDTGSPLWHYAVMNSPVLAVSPLSISRTVWIGNNVPAESSVVTNGGPGTVNYSISESASFFSLNSSGGSSAGEDDFVQITYDVANLPRGIYTGHITVSAAGASNSPQTLPVQVQVISVEPDFDGDGDVDQNDFGHLQTCYSGQAVPQTAPECQDALLDGDQDVDLADLDVLLGCASSEGVLANPTCAPGI